MFVALAQTLCEGKPFAGMEVIPAFGTEHCVGLGGLAREDVLWMGDKGCSKSVCMKV